jgi:hypothetical protein
MYEAAIQKTKDVRQAIEQARYTYCGRDCIWAVGVADATAPKEKFADWMANQTYPRFLQRQRSLQNKREMAALAFVSFCDRPGPWKYAPWMGEIDKKFSVGGQEAHSYTRSRRLSVFTDAVAKEVGCIRDDEIKKGDSSCTF